MFSISVSLTVILPLILASALAVSGILRTVLSLISGLIASLILICTFFPGQRFQVLRQLAHSHRRSLFHRKIRFPFQNLLIDPIFSKRKPQLCRFLSLFVSHPGTGDI